MSSYNKFLKLMVLKAPSLLLIWKKEETGC